MKRSIVSLFLVITILAFTLFGCSSATPTGQVPTQPDQAYPGAPSDKTIPYPSAPQSKPTAIATLIPKDIAPSSNQVGLIKGVLVITPPDLSGDFPGIYLGNINRDAKGNPLVTSLDKNSAPKARFDSKGNFVILDVKPGQYTLLVDMVESVFILKDSNGKERFLEIQGGQTIDVGDIKISK